MYSFLVVWYQVRIQNICLLFFREMGICCKSVNFPVSPCRTDTGPFENSCTCQRSWRTPQTYAVITRWMRSAHSCQKFGCNLHHIAKFLKMHPILEHVREHSFERCGVGITIPPPTKILYFEHKSQTRPRCESIWCLMMVWEKRCRRNKRQTSNITSLFSSISFTSLYTPDDFRLHQLDIKFR